MEVLCTTNWVELIDKSDFAKAALNENFKTFVIHVVALEAATWINPSQAAWIAILQ